MQKRRLFDASNGNLISLTPQGQRVGPVVLQQRVHNVPQQQARPVYHVQQQQARPAPPQRVHHAPQQQVKIEPPRKEKDLEYDISNGNINKKRYRSILEVYSDYEDEIEIIFN